MRTTAKVSRMARRSKSNRGETSGGEGDGSDGKSGPPVTEGIPEVPAVGGTAEVVDGTEVEIRIELNCSDVNSSSIGSDDERANRILNDSSGIDSSMDFNEYTVSTVPDMGSEVEVVGPDREHNAVLLQSGERMVLAFPGPPETGSKTMLVEATLDDNGHFYVGLQNQAMTCYLNSLVQTLYMTPEFRNAIYRWVFLGKKEDEGRSIACQLQKLFLMMQTSSKQSLETKDLTASFGWHGYEAHDQHDVQELCRVMFDALEHKWRGTVNESLIQDLYKGTMVDVVKCLKCKMERTRPDPFLDLPLAINHGGSGDVYKSVEEALHAFVKPELMDGDNQYSCDNCGSKQDALKSLRFHQFPYLLTIQLKRFDFDRNTYHRIKLHDKMTFPMVLNLNEFLRTPSEDQAEEPPKMSWAGAVAAKRKSPAKPAETPKMNYVAQAEEQPMKINRDEVMELIKKEGPCVYELFSIMVHQGNAAGGHYFAYIKNMDTDAWFCFNDSVVTAASLDELHKTFGGSVGGWSSSTTSAYMLMYRKIDPARNAKFVRTINLQPHLTGLLQRWECEEQEKSAQIQREQTLVNVVILYNTGKVPPEGEDIKQTLRIPYTSFLADVYAEALLKFAQLSDIKRSQDVRLVRCSSHNHDIVEHIKANDMNNTRVVDMFPDCLNKYRREVCLMLDWKPASMPIFYTISTDKTAFTLDVVPVSVQQDTATLLPVRRVQFADTETVGMIKVKIAALYSENPVDACNLRLVVDKGSKAAQTMIVLDDDTIRSTFLIANTVASAVTLYSDSASPGASRDEDRGVDFGKSKMFEVLDIQRNTMQLKLRLPNSADYKQAGMSAPSSMVHSRCETPVPGCATAAQSSDSTATAGSGSYSGLGIVSYSGSGLPVVSSSSCSSMAVVSTSDSSLGFSGFLVESPKIIRQQSVAAPQLNTSIYGTSPSHYSPASSNVSDDEINIMDCCPDDMSAPCTPIMSPSMSDMDDLSDVEEAKTQDRQDHFERIFNSVESTSSEHLAPELLNMNAAWFSPMAPAEQTDDKTQVSSSGTVTGGTQTPSSATQQGVKTLNKVVSDTFNELVLNLDGRELVVDLKEWIAGVVGVCATQFVVLKHYKSDDEGYESVAYSETECVRDAYAALDHISVKLRAPLKENERLIRVSRFDINNNDLEKWPLLFEVAGTLNTTVRELLKKCHDMLDTVYAQKVDTSRLRIRDLVASLGIPMLNLADRMGRRGSDWHKTVYLQILTDEQEKAWTEVGGACTYPVMVRRWKPSTLEVDPVVELPVSVGALDQNFALKQAIVTHYRVPQEQILLTQGFPTSAWAKWPFTKDRINLIESVLFSSSPAMQGTTINGKLVYFKLSAETQKPMTEDDKRTVRLKDIAAKSGDNAASRKLERPLRIQMSTSISEDNFMDSDVPASGS